MTSTQLHVPQATSSAVHLAGIHGSWGVPTFFPCYSCLICIIDVPFQAPGPAYPCLLSFPKQGSVVCTLISCPWLHPMFLSCRQLPYLRISATLCSDQVPANVTLCS